MPSLRIQFPDRDQPSAITLSGNRITIGRLPHNTVQIIDRTVSGFHAELVLEGDHYRLHDRGSTNGTFVNGEQTTDCHLREACKITFGSVEGDFALEAAAGGDTLEALPSRGEVNAVRQENAELKSRLSGLEEELSAARKLSAPDGETGMVSVAGTELAKLNQEREALKLTGREQEREIARLRSELSVLQRDRENLQKAADSNREALEQLRRQSEPAELSQSASPLPAAAEPPAASMAPVAPPLPVPAPTSGEAEPLPKPAPIQAPRVVVPAAKTVPPPAPPIVRPVQAAPPAAVKPPMAVASAGVRPAVAGSGLRPLPAMPKPMPGLLKAAGTSVQPTTPGGTAAPASAPGAAGAPAMKPIFQRAPQAAVNKPAEGDARTTEKIDVSKLPTAKPSLPGIKPIATLKKIGPPTSKPPAQE